MYYVIKKQHSQRLTPFISFKVPKYIASKNNANVIFEFTKDGKAQRKWVKKEDIILLTEDKKFFFKTLKDFQETQAIQQKLIDEAQEKLNQSLETFTETMNAQIDEFSEIKDSSDVPCILREL
jgi:replicative DNA helicase